MGEFTKEQLNCLKFTSVVKREFPIALRKTFKDMWDEKFGPSEIWDDSDSVRNSFLAKEGGAGLTKVPTQESYENCLLYTSPSPRDLSTSRMPSSA